MDDPGGIPKWRFVALFRIAFLAWLETRGLAARNNRAGYGTGRCTRKRAFHDTYHSVLSTGKDPLTRRRGPA
jgi:hypothetical protein